MKQKMKNEAQMRKAILDTASRFGVYDHALAIFERYDNLLKRCTNQEERKQIQIMGIAELHKLLGCRGPLVVNGELIIPGEEETDA